MEDSSRRAFIGCCLGGVSATLAVAGLYPVLAYLAPRTENSQQGTVSFAESDLPPDSARFFDYRGSTGVLVRTRGGKLIAFSAICTHLGCVVRWEKDQQNFLCPCHAGRYAPDGSVLSGPPPKPLSTLPLSVANGTITVG